ncbi:MAG: ParB/RepB/Spo0J family partition protein [Spirochaetaceae bacterium]|jgi:ParB family chromosome partitioning protein|nr:ParB/RepB/Spo0J family partition protein [Spirochaetaceae bacterium]
MASKFGLGKGLDALFPLEDPSGTEPKLRTDTGDSGLEGAGGRETVAGGQTDRGELLIPLELFDANPVQPRKTFDEAALQELADSIREHGIIQPIIVEKNDGNRYTIVAGERRFRAAKLAGLTAVPVLLREYSGGKRMEISLIENIQRADLNPVEEASAYRHLMEVTGLSQDEVAVRVGKNRSTVTNALRLLRLPIPILGSLESGAVSPGHARALLSVRKEDDQERLYQEILAEGISVREAEKRAAILNGGADPAGASPGVDTAGVDTAGNNATGGNNAGGISAGAKNTPEGKTSRAAPPESRNRDPHLTVLEQEFIELLGTKVVIAGTPEGGTIRIDYYSLEDLNRLYELLGSGNSGDHKG